MQAFKLGKINAKEKERILSIYADDIRLDYEDGETEEYWIGENGTTDLKMFHFWDGQGEIISFGKTIDELRKDTAFFKAIVTDEDVNHGINTDGELSEDSMKEIIDWITGKTNRLPITACGAENYYDDYLS